MRRFLSAVEALFPLRFGQMTFLVVPEAGEDVRIIQQDADGVRVGLPHQLADTLLAVQVAQLLQEAVEGGLFVEVDAVVDFRGVGGVEGDPQEDEAAVRVVVLFGTVEPAQGAVYAQAQILRVAVPLGALARFSSL